MRWPQPRNEDDFEDLCLLVLQEHWQLPSLERYGHRGDRQNGVDLWDPKGVAPRRAVQCKHHAPHKTLPPAEVEDEVRKARGFRHEIVDFFIVTTAKRSVHTADRVGEINDTQRAAGGFQVTVWYWDDVEKFISRSPRAQELLNSAPMKQTADLVVSSAQQILQATAAEHLGDEIAEVRRRIERGRLTEARELITALQDRRWDNLTNGQRARVLTHLAMIEEEQGRKPEAGQLLLRARDLAPDEEHSLANAPFAHELLGDAGGARTAAKEYARRFPHSPAAWAHVVQSLTPETTLDAARSELPEWALVAPEVLAALAEHAASSEAPEVALKVVHEAVEARGVDPRVRYRIGLNWFAICTTKLPEGSASVAVELASLRSEMGEAAAAAEAKGLTVLTAECRRLRGMANDLLGHAAEASADLSVSVELYPSSRGRLTYAQHLLARGAADDALAQLERNRGGPDVEATALVRAMALWQRNGTNDREEAIREFLRLSGECEGGNELEALTHAVHGLIVLNRADEAKRLLETKKQRLTFEADVLSARVCLALGERDLATEHAVQALSTLDRQPTGLRRWLAIVFGSLGKKEVALDVWERTVPERTVDNDTYTMFQLAMELGRDDTVLTRGQSLRQAGIFDDWLIQQELVVRERYNLVEALEVATEAVEHCPEDRFLLLRRSWLANRLGKPDLVSVEPDLLPPPEVARGDVGRVVVHLLIQKREAKRALEYAYQVYRRWPKDPDALRCMRDVFLDAREALGPADPAEVGADTAVRVEERDGSNRWFYLEDAADVDITRGEVGPETPLWSALFGSRVGATVVLSQGMSTERTAVVREVVSKYARRMQEVFETFEIVVPDRPELGMMHVGDGKGGFDMTPVIEMLKAARENADRAVATYAEHPAASLHSLALMLNRNELEALAELMRGGKAYRCARGTREEQLDAVDVVDSATEVVVELSAALSVFVLDGRALLGANPKPMITSQGTLEALRRIVRDARPAVDGPRRSAGIQDGQVVVLEESVEAAAARSDQAEAFLKEFEERVRIVPVPQLATFDPARRELLSDFFGWHGAEVLALSAVPGRAIWSDDFSLSEIAKVEFNCARTWTQALAMRLDSEGLLESGLYATLSANLVTAGYEFTSVNRSVLLRCGELADWNIRKPPLAQAIKYVGRVDLADRTAVDLALELLSSFWSQLALPASRANAQVILLETLLQRPKGRAALSAFAKGLPRIFQLNPIGLNDARQTLLAWMRASRLRLS